MPIYKSCLNEEIIIKIIKEKYNIEIINVEKEDKGSANIYSVFSKNSHYILKEYQNKFSEQSVNNEYNIFGHLKKSNFVVPEFIKTKDKKICFTYNNKVISLQKYIEGKHLNFYEGNKKQLKDSAKTYYNILNSLKTYNKELKEFNLDILNYEKIEKIRNEYLFLIHRCDDKNIRNELNNKLKMLNELNKIELKNIKKITIMNSHGDYNVSQFIYNDNNLIKVVLDYITAKKMPIIIEIFRSFIYLDKNSKNGEINIKNLIYYIREFSKHQKLNEYDIRYMVPIYYILMVSSVFGYKEYICDNSKRDYLTIGKTIYRQCCYLKENMKKITNALLDSIDYIEKKDITVYHLIDHKGFGTIHKLIVPLTERYSNHKIYTPYKGNLFLSKKIIKLINNEENNMIIIHSSGSKDSLLLNNLKNIFKNKKVYIFMHTSVEYHKVKGRIDFVNNLKNICDNNQITILVPSKEIANQYKKYGINTKIIQLGIEEIELEKYYKIDNQHLKKYYNKIITTCSSDKEIYKYVKGIDLYEKIIMKNNWSELSLVAGIDNLKSKRIYYKKFNERDFLNVLYHSKMYVQLSRYETYNVTAIQAKRFKKAVLLLDTEGTSSCMNGYVFKNINELNNEMIKVINGEYDYRIIENNYKDSIKRENLYQFKLSIERLEQNDLQITKK